MAKKKKTIVAKKQSKKCEMPSSCNGSALSSLGFIGALVYNISIATGFWMGVVGVLKAIAWPAFLVYSVMKYLGM